MMNEVQFEAFEAEAEAGRALMEELNEWAGLEGADVRRISRAVYKGTDCGAWLNVDERGLSVGSIVEGSDVDCTTHYLSWGEYLGMEEGELRTWLNSALVEIEEEANILWHEWNEEVY